MSPLKPVLQLAAACRQPHQMYLSKKLHDKVKELLEALHGGLPTFAPKRLQWLLRENKTFLFLDCNCVRFRPECLAFPYYQSHEHESQKKFALSRKPQQL